MKHEDNIRYLYIMVDPNQPGWIKFGEAQNLANRLTAYNVGSRGKQCRYHDTWDVPASVHDKDMHAKLRAVSEDQDHEWFKVDADEAANVIDAAVDAVWDEIDPEHNMHTIDEYMIDDIHGDDWAKVDIDMLTPAACDVILDRWNSQARGA